MIRNRNPLYVMAKPPLALAAAIGLFPDVAANRPPDLLHLTLLPLGDRTAIDERLFALILDVLGATVLPPFHLVFDRLFDSGRTIGLHPSETLRGAIAFQHALTAAFARRGLRTDYIFRPHITLAYRGRARDEIAVDPISWRVEDIRLIESVTGETRHVERGRWTLAG